MGLIVEGDFTQRLDIKARQINCIEFLVFLCRIVLAIKDYTIDDLYGVLIGIKVNCDTKACKVNL